MIKSEMTGGEPFTADFWVYGDDDNFLPLTNYTAKVQLRTLPKSGELIAEWLESDVEVLVELGHVQVLIRPAETSTFTFPVGFMDLLLIHDTDPTKGLRSDCIQIALNPGVTLL